VRAILMPRLRPGLFAGIAVLAVAIAVAFTTTRSSLRVPLLPQDPTQGRADAPLTLLEFTDYQCPYCRRFQAETWPALKRAYVDTGKVRFVLLDLPLDFHESAEPAAEAAHCAASQNRFWPMHDALLRSDASLAPQDIESLAATQGLDVPRFRACVSRHETRAAIDRNVALARSLGINGTPSFILGTMVDGELHGQPIMGSMPLSEFDAAIARAMPKH
jgi:protein-disulfide isomerase